MKSTEGFMIRTTAHAHEQIMTKGFSFAKVQEVFDNPANVYRSGKKYPNQHRVVGKGLCLVGEFEGNVFRLITVYRDNVVTPPRPDQLKTAEGQEFARRYAAGLGRSPVVRRDI